VKVYQVLVFTHLSVLIIIRDQQLQSRPNPTQSNPIEPNPGSTVSMDKWDNSV